MEHSRRGQIGQPAACMIEIKGGFPERGGFETGVRRSAAAFRWGIQAPDYGASLDEGCVGWLSRRLSQTGDSAAPK